MSNLNDHLFAQMERLSDEAITAEKLEQEIARGAAVVAVADQIIRNAALQLQAAKIISDHGFDPAPLLPMLEGLSKPATRQ
jgi:hypothetical protein